MRTYWLYLESYTMIFKKEHTALFYNTISGQHFKLYTPLFLLDVIEKLQDIENGYCIEISESELYLQETKDFIQLLRENFCGDVIDLEFTKVKPFSLYPVSSVMKNRERMKSNTDLSLGEKIMEYLHILTLQISGVCELKCESCSSIYRQTISCTSSVYELAYEFIEKILDQISGSRPGTINIIGGDVFRYTNWEKLIFLLNQYPYHYFWYTDYRHILGNEAKLRELKVLNHSTKIIVPGEFDPTLLKKTLQIISDMDCELIFYISTEEQYEIANTFCENNRIDDYSFKPVYSDFNPEFFRNHIFMDEESIVASPVSKQTIFANMNLNTIDFGKLLILSNGDVYANPHFPKLGNIKTDSIRKMIYMELDQGKSWLRIRDQKPCSDCIYQWLCPPPSNYEIVIGKPNLCHVKQS